MKTFAQMFTEMANDGGIKQPTRLLVKQWVEYQKHAIVIFSSKEYRKH